MSLLGISAALAACTAPRDHATLAAVAWAQTAAEHDAACLQVYAAATAAVAARAMVPAAALPPAVVLDVDETVLDNAAYQARLVVDARTFTEGSWDDWVHERRAAAILGAREFVQECVRRGVVVFYVTNRTVAQEAATRENLAALGFPLHGDDAVLSKGEHDTSSDKTRRRAFVTGRHTVIAWLGDDLGDFVTPAATVDARRQQVHEHRAKWGSEWFVLPNAMYGSWVRAVAKTTGLAGTEALRASLRDAR